jgi:hypothetical protein
LAHICFRGGKRIVKHDQTHQLKQADSGSRRYTKKTHSESPGKLKNKDADLGSLTGTPFSPRMDEHAALLSKMEFTAQRDDFILRLHQTYGSRYVQHLMRYMEVQPELAVSNPDDIYEREADRVADSVTKVINYQAQRQETEEEDIQLQSNESSAAIIADDLETRINSARGGGQYLSDNVKKPMEQAFGADFSGVRVHSDSEADTLNKQLSAKAFTTGQDIFFRDGEYSPASDSGKWLIAHELTHVVQQGEGWVNQDKSSMIGHPKDNAEQKRDTVTRQSDAKTIQRAPWIPTATDIGILGGLDSSTLDLFTIDDFMRYSGLYNMFEGYATAKLFHWEVHFLHDVVQYSSSGKSPVQAENIWDKYLRPDAPEPPNLSGAVMEPLKNRYAYHRAQARADFEQRTGESGADMTCPVCGELVLNTEHTLSVDDFAAALNEMKTWLSLGASRFNEFINAAKGYVKG